jgi:peptide/nickel transport system substrate-binding protein
MIQAQVMDGLLVFDPPTKQQKPALAESWEVSPDGKAYTLKLRKGVKFHDGSEFTAEAVALNFERVRDQSSKYYDKIAAPVANVFLSSADKVEVVDPYTVRYVLKQPNGDFLSLNLRTYMANPAVIKSVPPEDLGKRPSGTGPFKFTERQESRIVFDRNDGYWNGAPYIDKLVMRVYPDAAGAAAALEAGEIDVAVDVPISTAVRLQDKFKILRWASQFTYLFNFNMKHAATKDVRVRQALNYAVDRERLAKDLFKGQVSVARGVASPTFPSWSESVQSYPFDPAKAKQLLAEAGFGSGLNIRALQVTGLAGYPLLAELCQSVQADLKNVGVTLTYDVLDNQAFNREIQNGVGMNHAFYTYALGGITPSNLELVYGKRFQPPNGVNRNYYESPEAEKLFDAARGETDQGKRNQLYTQADKILRDDAVALFTVIYGTQAVHSLKVSGILDRLAWLDFSKTSIAQ